MRVRTFAVGVLGATALTLLGGGVAMADTPGQGEPNGYEQQWVEGGAALGRGVAAMSDSLVSGAPELVIVRTGQFLDMISD